MKATMLSLMGLVGSALLAVSLAGCPGSSVTGEYTCEGGLLDGLRLESGGKAYLTATMFGMKQEKAGTYTVDGDKVNVVINGESTVFTLTGKTLDGGGLVGKCTLK